MPYEWIRQLNTAPEQSGAVSAGAADDDPTLLAELHLWPYRSLPRRGFVIFIGITVALVAIPLIAVIGSPVLWGLLPFLAIAIGGVWWGIERSYRDGAIIETLCLWPDRMTLTRHTPRRTSQSWEANPHWVQLGMHPGGGPVEHYLTLKGAGREVEIGAFLSVPERKALYGELATCLARIR